MFQKFKKELILATFVMLLPVPVQLLLGREWGPSLLTPLLLLPVFWFCVWWTVRDPGNKNQGKKPLRVVFWIMPLLSVGMTAMDYCLSTGVEVNVPRTVGLLMGLMFLVIGNYLPKCRMNYTMGVKVLWAYTSEANWDATHRFAGKVWVICGLTVLLGSFLAEEWSFAVLLAATLLGCVLPTVYSWRFYLRQKAAGEPLRQPEPFKSPLGKGGILIPVVILAVVFGIMFTGDLEYTLGEDSFTVEASYHDDRTVAYEDIASVRLLEEEVDSVRVWGFAGARLLLGRFHSDALGGDFERYTYTGQELFILLELPGEKLLLSEADEGETRALYTALMEKVQ